MNWPRVALSEIARIERKTVHPGSIAEGTRYLGLESIERGGIIRGWQVIGETSVASSKFTFTERHLLFGKLRPNLGKIARPYFSGVCSTDILPIAPGPGLDRDYLAHFLSQPRMVDLAASRAAGANLPRLSPSELAKFEVPLPPLAEQRRIAALLDQADALRAKRRETLALLDDLNEAVFLDMFGDPVANSGAVSRLGDVAHIQIGPFGSLLHREDYVEGGIPLINPMHIVHGVLAPDSSYSVTPDKAGTLASYRIREGDVVMGRRGEMGRCGIAGPLHAGMLCGTGSLIIRPRPGRVLATYLWAALSQPTMKHLLERSALGATLPNLNTAIVNGLALSIPPLAMQERFEQGLRRVAPHRERVLASDAVIRQLTDALQARAFGSS